MATRLLQFVLPTDRRGELDKLFADRETLGRWSTPLDDQLHLESMLLASDKVEGVMDDVNSRFKSDERFRLVLLPVEATLPRPLEPETAKSESDGDQEKSRQRISREELYDDINDVCGLTRPFFAMVVLSTIIACVGLLMDNTPVVIGAMIMAPLLGPNVALALATTLGDAKLGRRALLSNLSGAGTAFAIAVGVGLLGLVNADVSELARRTHVELADILIAVAAGVGGTIAFTTGVPASVVGVMVAVALLPPLAATGMLLGAGEWTLAYRALLLLLVNICSVNLGGVGTFLVQGVRPPASWWEKERARRAVMRAGAAWLSVLVILAVAIYLAAD